MNAEPPFESAAAVPAPPASHTRPFYWSLWRELWDNPSIYIAPLIVAAVELIGFAISTNGMSVRRRDVLLLAPGKQRALIELPYNFAAIVLIFTAFIAGVFYCLEALHGERRDRSILFWKSLPVSDLTTVISKAAIPLLVLPLVIFATIVATHFIMLLWTSVVLLPSGLAGTTWTRLPLFQNWFVLLYGLIAIALWHAPIYGWTLLVSGWVRRATFLWAVLPLISIGLLEKIAFNSSHFSSMIKDRVLGFAPRAFESHRDALQHGIPVIEINSLAQLSPGRYLSSPSLWIGLIVAAAFLAAAIRLRRYRGPL